MQVFVCYSQCRPSSQGKRGSTYSLATLQEAYFACKDDESLSIRQAARKFGVTYSVLRDRVCGRVSLDKDIAVTKGARTEFTPFEERQLAEHLKMVLRY